MSVAHAYDARLLERFFRYVQLSEGCWEWTGYRSRDGYGNFNIDGTPILSHRVAWGFFFGPIPDGLHVLHHCDNPPCVKPSHLFVGTNLANIRDRQAKGRAKPLNSKLTEDQVRSIRVFAKSGWTGVAIAEHFGVASPTVSNILTGKAWRHVA